MKTILVFVFLLSCTLLEAQFVERLPIKENDSTQTLLISHKDTLKLKIYDQSRLVYKEIFKGRRTFNWVEKEMPYKTTFNKDKKTFYIVFHDQSIQFTEALWQWYYQIIEYREQYFDKAYKIN